MPLLVIFVMGMFGWILWKMFRRFTSKTRPIKVHAYPVNAPPVARLPGPSAAFPSETLPAKQWGGGV
jgi:hypothetical protein